MTSDPREMDTTGIEHDAINDKQPLRGRWVAVLLALLTVCALAYAVTDYVGQRDFAQQGERDAKQNARAVEGSATSFADQVIRKCRGASAEAKALRAGRLCGQASTTKAEVAKAIPGTAGAVGASGASGADGADGSSVPGRAGDPGARGRAGVDGADGSGSTVPGPQGARGDDSTVPGPAGPAGAAGKDGSNGGTGADGTNGNAGRGISSLSCAGSLTPVTFTVEFDDGTTATFTCEADTP